MIVYPWLFAFGIWLIVIAEKPTKTQPDPTIRGDVLGYWIAKVMFGAAGMGCIWWSIA